MLLVVRPGAPIVASLLLVAMPGAPSTVSVDFTYLRRLREPSYYSICLGRAILHERDAATLRRLEHLKKNTIEIIEITYCKVFSSLLLHSSFLFLVGVASNLVAIASNLVVSWLSLYEWDESSLGTNQLR